MFGVIMGNRAWPLGRAEVPSARRRGTVEVVDAGEAVSAGPDTDGAAGGAGAAAAGADDADADGPYAERTVVTSAGRTDEPDADDGRHRTLTLAALPSTPRWARALAREALCGWGMAAYADTMELLLSELVTNAVKAGGAGALVRVAIRAAADRLRIEVADAGTGSPHVDAPDIDTEGGRGLLLVSEISSDWGTYPIRIGSGAATGKVVWCEIAVGDGEAEATGDTAGGVDAR